MQRIRQRKNVACQARNVHATNQRIDGKKQTRLGKHMTYMEDVYHALARRTILAFQEQEGSPPCWEEEGHSSPAIEFPEGTPQELCTIDDAKTASVQFSGQNHRADHPLCQGKRYIVGICGSPGSGKSTLSRQVANIINSIHGDDICVVLPMDGFHYFRKQLDEFDDPKEAYARRGAHWTFDAEAFVETVERVAAVLVTGHVEDILVPQFDHGVGDPDIDNPIKIRENHKIVLVEGNYVLLDIDPWSRLVNMFDETWYIDCPVDTAMRRVYNRQTRHGVPPNVSRRRIETNDRINANQIAQCKPYADVLVPSFPFRHHFHSRRGIRRSQELPP